MASQAAQACTTCRKQKRKCDKTLPQCSRCTTLQRLCDYSESTPVDAISTPVPTAADFAALHNKLVEIEARLNVQPDRNLRPLSALDADAGSSTRPSPDSYDLGWPPSWTDDHPVVRRTFPSVLFLDIDVYRNANITPQMPEVEIPAVSQSKIYGPICF